MLISFLFLNKNICCGYLLEAPRRDTSNEYPQHMFLSRNKKNIMWIPHLICSYAKQIFVAMFLVNESYNIHLYVYMSHCKCYLWSMFLKVEFQIINSEKNQLLDLSVRC